MTTRGGLRNLGRQPGENRVSSAVIRACRAAFASGLLVCGVALAVMSFKAPELGTMRSKASHDSRSVLAALASATKLSDKIAADTPLTLTVVLNRTDPKGFERFLDGVQDPKSRTYRRYLGPREQADRFGPSVASFDEVRTWLEQQGFKPIEGSANRLTLTVSGTRAQAERAFHVRIKNDRRRAGIVYTSDRDPTLPESLIRHVQTVVGLSSVPQPLATHQDEVIKAFCANPARDLAQYDFIACSHEPHSTASGCLERYRQTYDDALKNCIANPDKFAKSASNGPSGGGSSSSVSNLTRMSTAAVALTPYWLNVDGSGQTVGLLEFDTFNRQDIADYLQLIGRPADAINRLSEVHVNGGAAMGVQEAEVLIDLVAVMTNAPGAKVVVYDAPFAGIRTSFQTLFNKMINDGVSVISNSWVYCEDQATLADVQSIDSIFASAAAAGITVLNSTGDFGSTCGDGSANTVSVPADAPHATAVGGTSLIVAPALTYGSESFWNRLEETPPTGAGGFGVSKFFSRPAYQNGFSTSPLRSVPDVSLNADPAKGIQICQADAGGCPTGAQYGGTSLAAPLWAAFVALLNQAQGQNLGELNPLLYPLGNSNAFHSAASMGSDFQHAGLGSPNLNLIHLALTGKTAGSVSAAVSENTADPNGSVADSTAEAFVVVRLRDADGHTVRGKTVTLIGNSGSHATVTPANGVSNVANGAVIFSIKDTTPEIVTFTATDTTDGVVLQKQVDVAFVARPAAAGGISASPTTVTANGSDTTTITVTLQDAKGDPSPDKLVNLAQGNGASIISTTTATTDATGRVQFTAVSSRAETVTYTAVDVSDRNLPIPGSATVSFVNASGFCSGFNSFNFGTAAPGYAVTTFASSFPIDCFSGIGPIGVAFDAQNNLLVGNIANNVLYSFTPQGGIAGPATRVGTVTPSNGSVGGLAFGRDGRLYAASGSQVVELNPATAAVIRVVATLSGEGPKALAFDPLSGDLFVSKGFDGIKRISNFTSGTGTVSPYATGDVDGMVFDSDGTLYVASDFGNVIARVAGTNTPNPGTLTVIANLTKPDGLALEPNPANPAKPFLYANRNDGVITRIDTNALPGTPTNPCGSPCQDIYTGGSRGDFVTVGVDRCLYATQSDRVIKVSNADGTCGLASISQAPQIVLTPQTVSPSPAQGALVTFSASLKNVANPADVPITLLIAGANPGPHLVRTDANGNAAFTYTGVFTGTDELFASGEISGSTLFSNTANVTWTSGKHSTFLTVNLSPSSGTPNKPLTLIANLVDISVLPAAPVTGATVNFTLAGQTCNGVTDGTGKASCSVTPVVAAGSYPLRASFAGTTQLLSSSASKTVDLIVTPPHQLLNISTRMRVLTGDNVLIGGFIITGTESKKVIIRGLGPSLTKKGVPGALQDPTLELHKPDGTIVVNDNWKDAQRAEIEATGIPPSDDRESAIVATLPPGNYTAILAGKGGLTGVGLVEVYDISQPANSQLANISTRGFVETGDNVMIGGFIAGPSSGGLAKVLIRAIGPSLPVSGALQDPILELHDVNGATLFVNDNWKDTQEQEIRATTIPPSDGVESAMVQSLAPGNYTAIVRGKNNATGVGLVEVYDLQ